MRLKLFACVSLWMALHATSANAGLELVCKGQRPTSNNKPVFVDCSDRRSFVEALSSAWMTLRRNQIGGSTEDLCWKAYQQAKDMHPSIGFENISDSFFVRCNMGLAYVK